MLTEEEFLKEEKECADLIGINLKEYRESLKNIKILPKKENKKVKYNNTILYELGLTEKDLKNRENW